jgi:hypothetical protein
MPSSTLQHCVRRRCTHAQRYIARARGEGSDGQIRRKTLTCRTHILDAWPRPLPHVKYQSSIRVYTSRAMHVRRHHRDTVQRGTPIVNAATSKTCTG